MAGSARVPFAGGALRDPKRDQNEEQLTENSRTNLLVFPSLSSSKPNPPDRSHSPALILGGMLRVWL